MKPMKIVILTAVAAILMNYSFTSEAAQLYTVRSSGVQYCLASSAFNEGAPVTLQVCNYFDFSQHWLLRPDGTLYNGLCMDVLGGNRNRGTPVRVWHCNNSLAQRWQYSMGALRSFVDSRLRLCLDVPSDNTYVGAKLWIWSCNSSKAQDWYLR